MHRSRRALPSLPLSASLCIVCHFRIFSSSMNATARSGMSTFLTAGQKQRSIIPQARSIATDTRFSKSLVSKSTTTTTGMKSTPTVRHRRSVFTGADPSVKHPTGSHNTTNNGLNPSIVEEFSSFVEPSATTPTAPSIAPSAALSKIIPPQLIDEIGENTNVATTATARRHRADHVAPAQPPVERKDFYRLMTIIGTSRDPQWLEQLNQTVQDYFGRGLQPTATFYQVVLGILKANDRSDLEHEWLQKIRQRLIDNNGSGSTHLTLDQYHELMSAFVQRKNYRQAEQVFEEIQSLPDLKPTASTFNIHIKCLMRTNRSIKAMELVQGMPGFGITPDLTTYDTLIEGHLRNKDIRLAQKALESLLLTNLQPDIWTFNTLMAGYCNLGETTRVHGFFKTLSEYGLVPDRFSYTILMKAYMQERDTKKVVNLFTQLKQSSKIELQPTTETYRILLRTLVNGGKMPEAIHILQEMLEEGTVPVDTSIYTVFLTQYAKERKVDMARRVLDRIIGEKLRLVDGCFNPLIREYLSRGDQESVREMMELMDFHGVKPTIVTYNIMMHSMKQRKNIQGAMALIAQMEKDKIEPDIWSFNTLLDLLVDQLKSTGGERQQIRRKGEMKMVTKERMQEIMPKVEQVFREMNRLGISPDHATYGTMIQQYILLGDIDGAERSFHEMMVDGKMTPTLTVFNSLMNGFTKIEQMDKALELLRMMPKYNVKPDVTTFSTLVKGYSHMSRTNLAMAQTYANMMHHDPTLVMDRVGYNTLMHLAKLSSKPKLAVEFFHAMRSEGLDPDVISLTILIEVIAMGGGTGGFGKSHEQDGQGHEQHQQPSLQQQQQFSRTAAAETIESLFETIHQEGYELNPITINSMLSAYFRLGLSTHAIEFFKRIAERPEVELRSQNCGAFLFGLLKDRKYDGIVLNLYSRMLVVTREQLIKEQQMTRQRKLQGGQKGFGMQGRKSLTKTSAVQFVTEEDEEKEEVEKDGGEGVVAERSKDQQQQIGNRKNVLPNLDLVSFRILFQAFAEDRNWRIVMQLWKDVNSLGAHNIYPYEMPLDFYGWAAQAYYHTLDGDEDDDRQDRRVVDKEQTTTATTRKVTRRKDGWQDEDLDSTDEIFGLSDSVRVLSNKEKAKKLVRKIGSKHLGIGMHWSWRIYGANIFQNGSSSSSSSSSSSTSTGVSEVVMAGESGIDSKIGSESHFSIVTPRSLSSPATRDGRPANRHHSKTSSSPSPPPPQQQQQQRSGVDEVGVTVTENGLNDKAEGRQQEPQQQEQDGSQWAAQQFWRPPSM